MNRETTLHIYASDSVVVVDLTNVEQINDVSSILSVDFSWDEEQVRIFTDAFKEKQDQLFKDDIYAYLNEKDWREADIDYYFNTVNSYSTSTSIVNYFDSLVARKVFTLDQRLTPEAVADELIIQTSNLFHTKESRINFIDSVVVERILSDQYAYVIEEAPELPDMELFPPYDVSIQKKGTTTQLRFSTTYYNSGRGRLELTADPSKTKHNVDVYRDVLQTITYPNGSTTKSQSGNFYWHASHQHYHFTDFVDYRLERIDDNIIVADGGRSISTEDTSGDRLQKATFCIRDVSKVSGVESADEDASFKICSKWRQGVSIGWGDTYFADYPDQFLDISGLESGTYKLSFHVNPRDRFKELSYLNNYSYVLVEIDLEKREVEILESSPSDLPDLTHVYLTQTF